MLLERDRLNGFNLLEKKGSVNGGLPWIGEVRVRIMRVISRFSTILKKYPRQFWLVSLIMLLAWLFHSLIWPYLMLYISQRLGEPLSSVAWLMTLNAAVGMVTTFMGGAIADRFGRKGVMVFSLIFSALGWFLFRAAGTLPVFALLLVVTGASTPLYRLASDAMVADLIPEANRLDAYSVLRMGNNFGVVLGPAIGGYLASISYGITFGVIGVGFGLIAVFVTLLIIETKPASGKPVVVTAPASGGYLRIFKDRVFMVMMGAYTLNRISTSILWLLLAVYAKQNFGVSEKMFGFIPMTNALMVVLFQLVVTRQVNRFRAETAMTTGALIYAIAIFCVAFGSGFWWFWLCMVAATIGEMILVPTTTTFTASLAPEDMRARYMSLYALTWGIGTGLGPLLAGYVSDVFSSRAMWYAAGLVGFAGFLAFSFIARLKKTNPHGFMHPSAEDVQARGQRLARGKTRSDCE